MSGDVFGGENLSYVVERDESFFLFVEVVEGGEELPEGYLLLFFGLLAFGVFYGRGLLCVVCFWWFLSFLCYLSGEESLLLLSHDNFIGY